MASAPSLLSSVLGSVQNLFNRPKSWAGAANLQPGQRRMWEFFLEDVITNETTSMDVIYVTQLIQNAWQKPDPIVPLPLTYFNYINITKTDNYYLIISEKQRERKRKNICVIKSKARKTNLFNATVKEAKVKEFAILFLVLSWFHQGNHKKLSFNISKSTLINFRWNIFLHTLYLLVVSHSIIFIKIGTACLSFSRLNFSM